MFGRSVEILKCACPRASYLQKVTCPDKILFVLFWTFIKNIPSWSVTEESVHNWNKLNLLYGAHFSISTLLPNIFFIEQSQYHRIHKPCTCRCTVLAQVFAHPVSSHIRIVHVKIAKSLEKLRWRLLVCED
jgi:hypothetical protein